MNENNNKNIIVLYHRHCFDGFAAAWSAWRVYGDKALYVAVNDRQNIPEEVFNTFNSNTELYILDFCYPKELLLKIEKEIKKIVVLDHHASVKDDIESIENHVYGTSKSGAYLSWEYFHPSDKVPLLIEYISDADTLQKNMPNWEIVSQYIYTTNFEFEDFNRIYEEFQSGNMENIHNVGKIILNYLNIIFRPSIEGREIVEFEGYKVYATNASLPIDEKSRLGMWLYENLPPFSIVYRYDNGLWKVSLRGNGEVDLSLIAQKYGGGGHRNAAGFAVPSSNPLPFVKAIVK